MLVFDTAFSDSQVSDLYDNNTATGALLHWAFDAEMNVLDGDLNGDGSVGSADLDIVRANWGATVTPGDLAMGDPSGDGTVGSADLDVVRANWGASLPATAVPEPGAVVLMITIAFAGACRTRRTH